MGRTIRKKITKDTEVNKASDTSGRAAAVSAEESTIKTDTVQKVCSLLKRKYGKRITQEALLAAFDVAEGLFLQDLKILVPKLALCCYEKTGYNHDVFPSRPGRVAKVVELIMDAESNPNVIFSDLAIEQLRANMLTAFKTVLEIGNKDDWARGGEDCQRRL